MDDTFSKVLFKQLFQTQQGCELTETVTAYVRPAQVHTRQNPSSSKGKWVQSPHPKLFVIENRVQRVGQFIRHRVPHLLFWLVWPAPELWKPARVGGRAQQWGRR